MVYETTVRRYDIMLGCIFKSHSPIDNGMAAVARNHRKATHLTSSQFPEDLFSAGAEVVIIGKKLDTLS